MYSSWTTTGEVPAAVETRTSTVRLPAGTTADSVDADETLTPEARLAPNMTVASGAKPLPVTVTRWPPTEGPATGETAPTVGADNLLAQVRVPLSRTAPLVVVKRYAASAARRVSERTPNSVSFWATTPAGRLLGTRSWSTPPEPTMNSVTPPALGRPGPSIGPQCW